MIEKKIIQELEKIKSNYTSPESAQDQANSLESLSSDIYTDSKRFIYELIQNADDASSNSGQLEISLKVVGNYLIISHQGEKFSEIDIESICSVGDGNKKGDGDKTGFKGIGFKSVFSHSDYVKINSGNYCFKFDKSHWKNHWNNEWKDQKQWQGGREKKGKETSIKMPWQIIPIWSELEESLSFVKSYNVSTIIKYRETSKLEKELFELFSNTQILLFLRCQNVKITIEGNKPFVIEKIKDKNTVKLKQNNQVLSEWLLKSFSFNVDKSTNELIKNDVRIPKKLRLAAKTEISLAVQIDKGRIKAIDNDNRLIFTYLPTSVNYDFPFLVNASFITDAGRQHLHEDLQWNAWLFKQIPIKLFEWLAELAQSSIKKDILKLIPHKFTGNSELKQSFNHGFDEAVKKTAFLPSNNDALLKVSNSIFDETNISKFLEPKIIIDFINSKNGTEYTIDSYVAQLESVNVLARLGVEKFDIDGLSFLFNSKFFVDNHKRSENFRLITFLKNQSDRLPKGDEQNNWNQKLQNTSFVFDENMNLKSPKNIYFPAIEFSDEFSDELSIIHSKTMEELESNNHIKKWLIFLGVTEPSDISFIEKTIIGNENFISEDNANAVGRYLFRAYQKGLMTDIHFKDLQQVNFLTKEGSLKPACSLFLSDKFEPKLKLESVYNNDVFISDLYCLKEDIESEWKTFFIKIGINHSIEVKKLGTVNAKNFQNVGINQAYFDNGVEEAKSKENYKGYSINYISNLSKISFIEFANQYSFSKLFWEQLFLKFSPSKFRMLPNMPMGYYNGYCSLENYNLWAFKNLKIFPATNGNCFKAESVFINSKDNIELCGKYMNVLDFHEIIPEEWLKILPFKKILELDDYLKVLSSIWQDEDADEEQKKENKKRIELLYEKISDNYLGYQEKLKDWALSNKLLAKDGKSFFYPNDLSVVTAKGFKAPNLAFCDEKNINVIELLKIFGVSIIDTEKPRISNSQTEIKDLKNQLNHILPLIAVVSVEKSKSKKHWEIEYNRLTTKLAKIQFIETTEIWLSYGNEADEQKKSSYPVGNVFYYVGNWYKPRVLDGLIEPIGDFLGINYAERLLSVLLTDTFKEGVEYLKEKFGKEAINLIPDELLNPKETEVTPPNADNRAYNQSDEDLGRKGEMFVFDELKKIYSRKYNSEIIETDEGFKVGLVNIIWRNKQVNTTFNHDFKIEEDGSEIYIDSKATPFSESIENVAFYVSPNELDLMESVNRYLIARVYKVTSNPKMKFIRMNIEILD
jgi:hypothetical protein